MNEFEQAFRAARDALGLAHYDVRFATDPGPGNYACIEPDPGSCTAICRVDLELCERDDQTSQVAVHEVLHLLVADLRHAIAISPETGDWIEEQTVRKIEALIFAGLGFGVVEEDEED
jgi:hypothetical protein